MTSKAAPATAPPGAGKGFLRGTHRTVEPEVTLAYLQPRLAAMGITRVGMLTGLDRVGLPVAMAVRPNGRALSVAQGKGVTVAAAKVSAIMEAAEAFHAETVTGPLYRGAAAELPRTVDPHRLPLAASGPEDDPRTARFLWIAGIDLQDSTERLVPFETVHADFTVPAAEPVRFQATTSGLAAGNLDIEAQLHALYEAIERDAIACWREAGGPGAATARPLRLDAVDDPDVASMLAQLAALGIGVVAWDVTSDIQVPAILAMLLPEASERSAVEAELGSGCHLDPAVALSRALTEAAQTRLTRIAGARDDFDPASYGDEARRRRRTEARNWLTLGRRGQRPWEHVQGIALPADDLDGDFASVLRALRAVGCDQAVWVDLARPDLAIPVGRIVVPGLEGPWLPGLYRAGSRAKRKAR